VNKIYIEISKLTDFFREMAYGIITDENKINEAVQELMLYFLQMNPKTLENIYEKDGIMGIKKYGAVALRRALTSTRSPNDINYQTQPNSYYQSITNIPQSLEDEARWEKLEKIDKALDKLDSWYDRELFKLYYYEGNTLDSLASKTKISRNSLFTTIDKVREIIKKDLSEEREKTEKDTKKV
jgi:RNA polymerase sigma factor (sigma-70 family)